MGCVQLPEKILMIPGGVSFEPLPGVGPQKNAALGDLGLFF
jgi:hypothetical protein